MSYQGDLAEDALLYFDFTSRATTGVPTVLSGTPALSVYKDDDTTESTAGITLAVSHDSRVGRNNVKIDTSADAFYAVGGDYSVVLTAGTVGGVSVIGEKVGSFSIENRFTEVDVNKWLGTTVSTPAVAGRPAVDAIAISSNAATADNLEFRYDKLLGSLVDSATFTPTVTAIEVTTGVGMDDAGDNTYKGMQVRYSDGGVNAGKSYLITSSEGTTTNTNNKVKLFTVGQNTAPADADSFHIIPGPTKNINESLGTLNVNQTSIKGDESVSGNLVLQYDGSTGLAGATFPASQAQVDDVPTAAEFTARTLPAADYFDPAIDVVENAIAVGALASFIEDMFTVDSGKVSGDEVAGSFILEMVKVNWDRLLRGNTHNITGSSGRRLREVSAIIFNSGTAQSGGTNSIRIAAGAVGANDRFRRAKVILTEGTGAGQEAIITSSLALTDTLTITPAWETIPSSDTGYQIEPAQVHTTVQNGGYDGGFVFFKTGGNVGREKGVNGTSTNPVGDEADAYAIMVEEKSQSLFIQPGSVFVLPSDSSDRFFEGTDYNVILNSQIIEGLFINGATSITGEGFGGSGARLPRFTFSGLGDMTVPPFNANEIGLFADTITFNAIGDTAIGASTTIQGKRVAFDFGAFSNGSSLNCAAWRGGDLEIKNTGGATGTQVRVAGWGDLLIDVSCIATTIVKLFGDISHVNDGAALVIKEANYTETQVKALVEASFNQAIPELGVGTPSSTPSIRNAQMLMYMALANKLDVDTSTPDDKLTVHNSSGTAIASKVLTDDGQDYSERKMS